MGTSPACSATLQCQMSTSSSSTWSPLFVSTLHVAIKIGRSFIYIYITLGCECLLFPKFNVDVYAYMSTSLAHIPF